MIIAATVVGQSPCAPEPSPIAPPGPASTPTDFAIETAANGRYFISYQRDFFDEPERVWIFDSVAETLRMVDSPAVAASPFVGRPAINDSTGAVLVADCFCNEPTVFQLMLFDLASSAETHLIDLRPPLPLPTFPQVALGTQHAVVHWNSRLGAEPQVIQVYDTDTGSEIFAQEMPDLGTYIVKALGDAVAVASSSELRIYDIATWATIQAISIPSLNGFLDKLLDFEINDSYLVVAKNGGVFVIDTGSGLVRWAWPDDLQSQPLYNVSVIAMNDQYVVINDVGVSMTDDDAEIVNVFESATGTFVDRYLTDSAFSSRFGQTLEIIGDTLYIGDPSRAMSPSNMFPEVIHRRDLSRLSPCRGVDLVEPYVMFTFGDVLEYLRRFESDHPSADLAPPCGKLNVRDVAEFAARTILNCNP
jgi:hypothetical protein